MSDPAAAATRSEFTPVDVDAEVAVVAALLTSPDVFFDVADKLTPDDFGTPQLQLIYDAILGCDAQGKPFDQITVVDELKRRKQLTKAGGRDGIQRIVGRAADVHNVAAHVDIVSEKSLLRRAIAAGRSISQIAQDPASDRAQVLEHAEESVFSLSAPASPSSLVSMPQAVAAMTEEMARAKSSQLLGVPTGFPELDAATSGFQPGQLIVVAARPGGGKSAWALGVARHIAETTGAMVPMLSYEMSTSETVFRMLATGARHPLQELRAGRVVPGRDRDIANETAKMAQLPVLIDDNPPQSVVGVRSAMRRLSRRGPIAAIVIDYMQLMKGESRTDNRAQEVGEISRGLKRLASELQVPVIALSQLNRELEKRPGDKKPRLSDLRESGSLEQDASAVIFLHRPWLFDNGIPPHIAQILLAKQRNGPAGIEIDVTFEADWAGFVPGKRGGSAPPADPGSLTGWS